ncbi:MULTISPECIES: lipase maturation factor family protein [Mycobacterium]|uniref:Membrane protein n=1 Tax=Mycobacterium kiyosense TaxID=2871094 RepID=A0A9P3V0C9_9MYCO|nr:MULTISPECIES: lipase maturation factor family protein [Mycobacterium]BDB40068.1 membrane protein [Mycobacterium kiyosense]BDE11905.1 membrane protein [Mycobacterium sp. 20KCMC460]GLB84964.1 membrane protein [Mycobacterium kiyosense]GLB92035.1 membrane protein [Mycobacterium kiyosense]GLB98174.1 membrane protein [Mycobacterium kiyosense]
MTWFSAPDYWLGSLVLQRGVAVIYAIAFVAAARQFRPLLGARGLLPVPAYLAGRSFWQAPSIFQFRYSDRFFASVCWFGAALAAAVAAGSTGLVPVWAGMLVWLTLWVLYLSIVNVGQTWYGFGWESLLLEAGFLLVFLGGGRVAPPVLTLWLARWLLFRVEFGAGLIKMRGDRCWRDLTCLYYHHETQPMPGPLSWFFHHLPKPLHRIEVAGNHFAQLVVPFGLFAPQPVAGMAAAVIVVTQLWLVLSGNFAWLNWLTILLAFSAIDQSTFARLGLAANTPEFPATPPWFAVLVIALAAAMLVLSYWPARNMLSSRQRMNASFNAFHLCNTYGAFGSISRTRYEVVVEGTADTSVGDQTVWREYEFKGKPGSVRRLPRQFAPYHLRLDWLMWFAAISPGYALAWLTPLLTRLLRNDADTLKLLRHNPFPDTPPHFVRAQLYQYRFTTPTELRRDRAWWHRTLIGSYAPPRSLPR